MTCPKEAGPARSRPGPVGLGLAAAPMHRVHAPVAPTLAVCGRPINDGSATATIFCVISGQTVPNWCRPSASLWGPVRGRRVWPSPQRTRNPLESQSPRLVSRRKAGVDLNQGRAIRATRRLQETAIRSNGGKRRMTSLTASPAGSHGVSGSTAGCLRIWESTWHPKLRRHSALGCARRFCLASAAPSRNLRSMGRVWVWV
jgi:hypothetical protein